MNLTGIRNQVSTTYLLETAAALLSEEGENTEYDRAIVELTTALLGLGDDHKDVVELALKGARS